jgi:hypothetical protein
MNRDFWLPLVVSGSLVGILAASVALWQFKEAGRPVLLEARIVTASSQDPVFREGPRTLAPGEQPLAAVAVKLSRRNNEGTWLAPVSNLVLDGEEVDHIETDAWPEEDRYVRVFWFTVECDHMGGELRQDNAAELINYRSFIAPELGRGLRANLDQIEAHNDDQVTPEDGALEVSAGSYRLYCRVEIVEKLRSVLAEQSVTTPGPADLLRTGAPTFVRHLDAPPGIRAAVGEYFLLPGFEPSETDKASEIRFEPLQMTLNELIDAHIVVTSRALAHVAVSGETHLSDSAFRSLGEVRRQDDTFLRQGGTLRWGRDIKAGDALTHKSHWLVFHSDVNSNGLLDGEDLVLHSWRRPPALLPLGKALDEEETLLHLKRHEG